MRSLRQRGCGSTNILVVDDEPEVLHLTKLMLERLGHRVATASTPAEAEQHVREHGQELSLLVSDVSMPGMSGWELAERVRAERPELKCLIMSGYADGVNSRTHPERQAQLQKPFSLHDLASAIARVLHLTAS